jgi:hypothetical protein
VDPTPMRLFTPCHQKTACGLLSGVSLQEREGTVEGITESRALGVMRQLVTDESYEVGAKGRRERARVRSDHDPWRCSQRVIVRQRFGSLASRATMVRPL